MESDINYTIEGYNFDLEAFLAPTQPSLTQPSSESSRSTPLSTETITNTSSQSLPQPQQQQQPKKKTFARACDSCSVRKVKCDLKVPCNRCLTHSLKCTNNRIKKKCGPKKIHEKTRDAINQLAVTTALANDEFVPLIPLEKLLPCLNVYQVWYYGIWPVISVAELISRSDPDAYALSCAVCATITNQVSFITNQKYIPQDIINIDFASEAIRVKKLQPTLESILTSFFLHIAITCKHRGPEAICYLREAITLAQMMGLDKPENYVVSTAEVHRMRKIYYLLLVTERFLCLEQSIPVLLEPSIPFPSLNHEEYSVLLSGFRELIKIFAIPNKSIFEQFRSIKNNEESLRLICTIQNQLKQIEILKAAPDIQKANILLSKYWMSILTWNIANENNMLNGIGCLSNEFPITMSKEFCQVSKNLPLNSFQFNGSGVSFKLITIAKALIKSIKLTQDYSGYEYFKHISNILSHLRIDLTSSNFANTSTTDLLLTEEEIFI
ncbi:hypothetical protein KGF54_002039 [Candida jiufengensis]|uniref:uncharacterized protein n=1 Tax=Candida jiufengensis TaxID=497108 RepID=UPI0022240690|nr:uncharacterized protein KGF54_002039 [Candida jiufengensis]KAI5954264.1 hypothetical protein KGF54_002039 [Candida jiufengensis]